MMFSGNPSGQRAYRNSRSTWGCIVCRGWRRRDGSRSLSVRHRWGNGSRFDDVSDSLADRDLGTSGSSDVGKQARSRSFEFDRGLIGLNFHQRLSLHDHLTLGFEPADNLPCLLGHTQSWQDDIRRHRSSPPSLSEEGLPADITSIIVFYILTR